MTDLLIPWWWTGPLWIALIYLAGTVRSLNDKLHHTKQMADLFMHQNEKLRAKLGERK